MRAFTPLDGDGDLDVVSTHANLLVWFENQNGVGTTWSAANVIAQLARATRQPVS